MKLELRSVQMQHRRFQTSETQEVRQLRGSKELTIQNQVPRKVGSPRNLAIYGIGKVFAPLRR